MDTFDHDPNNHDPASPAEVAATPVLEAPSKPRNRWLMPGLITAGVLAIGAVAFATMNATDAAEGFEEPELAMEQLFVGLAAQDFVASAEAFLPSEADPAVEYATATIAELKRLGVLSDSADLEDFPGIDLEFSGLTYDVVEIAPGFARVYVTGGEATSTMDPAALPLGSLLSENIPDEELNGLLSSGPQSDVSSMAGEDFFMVAVDDDGWYLSLWYTIAEAARLDAGGPVPDFGNGLQAAGAASAEEAVRAAFNELLELDLEGLAVLLPPDEMRALHDYLPLVLDDYNQQVGTLAAFINIELDSLETTTSDAGDGKVRVAVDTFAVSFESPFLEIDGAITFDGQCFDVAINDNGGNLSGLGEIPPRINSCELEDQLGATAQVPDFLTAVKSAEVGLIAVEAEDGLWYISPVHTVGDAMLQSLEVWDASTIQEYIDFLMNFEMGASPALF